MHHPNPYHRFFRHRYADHYSNAETTIPETKDSSTDTPETASEIITGIGNGSEEDGVQKLSDEFSTQEIDGDSGSLPGVDYITADDSKGVIQAVAENINDPSSSPHISIPPSPLSSSPVDLPSPVSTDLKISQALSTSDSRSTKSTGLETTEPTESAESPATSNDDSQPTNLPTSYSEEFYGSSFKDENQPDADKTVTTDISTTIMSTGPSCPGSVLRVAGIPEQWNPRTLFDVFSSYDKVDSTFIYDDKDEYGKRQGLVQMNSKESASSFPDNGQMLMVGNIILQIFSSELSSTRDVFSYINLSSNYEKNYYCPLTSKSEEPSDITTTICQSTPPPSPASNPILHTQYSPAYPYPIPQPNHWQLSRPSMMLYHAYGMVPPYFAPDGLRMGYPISSFSPYSQAVYPGAGGYPMYSPDNTIVPTHFFDQDQLKGDQIERIAFMKRGFTHDSSNRRRDRGAVGAEFSSRPNYTPSDEARPVDEILTSLTGTDNCRLYVKNLDHQVFTTNIDFKRVFMEFGRVKSAKLCHPHERPFPSPLDRLGGKPQRLFGFVEYLDHRSALNALVQMNGLQVGCFTVSVEFAYSNDRMVRNGRFGRNNKPFSKITSSSIGTNSDTQISTEKSHTNVPEEESKSEGSTEASVMSEASELEKEDTVDIIISEKESSTVLDGPPLSKPTTIHTFEGTIQSPTKPVPIFPGGPKNYSQAVGLVSRMNRTRDRHK